jgi:hypothetical protein
MAEKSECERGRVRGGVGTEEKEERRKKREKNRETAKEKAKWQYEAKAPLRCMKRNEGEIRH